MSFIDFVSIANVIDLMLEHWVISACALLVFVLLCIGVFRGFKKSLKLIVILLVLDAIGFTAYYLYKLITGSSVTELIAIAVAWVPTVLFVLIILIYTLVGVWRGLRKSLILTAHAFCAGALCIGLFFLCISSPLVDGLLLDAVNAVMGGDFALQNALGVSGECSTLRETLASFLITLPGDGGGLDLVLAGSGEYVMTLVDLGYRLAFAIVFSLIYFLLVFILYIIYHACYSERKYKAKKNLAFVNNQTGCSYRKHRIGGGAVGLVRGLAVGLITMSFLGSALFIVAGGTGDGKLKDLNSGNKDTDFIYSVYRSFESYGSQGIFQVLNAMRNPEDTPYYLFAADLIFSGGLDDEQNGISENIKFREELGAYTGFARETFALLMKYGEEELTPILNGGSAEDMQVILEVITKPGFRVEFENLVDNFDSKTYIINFSLSLVNSVIDNIDEVEFADAVANENKELLKVLFKRGYLSRVIPDERELADGINSNAVDGGEVRPYISVNKLLTKRDVQTVLSLVLSFISDGGLDGEIQPFELVKDVLPQIEGLSIFSTERSAELDPVLARMYCLLENQYLTDEGQEGIRYSEIAEANVSWGREIRSLLSLTDGLFTLYGNVYSEDKETADMLLTVFDKEDGNYSENIAVYDRMCEVFSDSALIGRVLASGRINNIIRTALSGLGEVYVPENIKFENTYDGDGILVSHGEAYQLFYGLRLIGENRQLLDTMLNSDGDTDVMDVLDNCASVLENKDERGNRLSDYLTGSVLLRSVISSVMIEQGGEIIAVPSVSLEREGNTAVKLINAPELKQIFDCLPDILELIKPIAEDELKPEYLAELLDDKTLNSLLDSGNAIIEGTVANQLIKLCGDGGAVVIPKKLKNFENWVTFGAPGELRKLLNSVKAMNLDYEQLLNGELSSEDMFDTLNGLSSEDIVEILNSDVMHYTVSDYMQSNEFGFGSFTVIIPSSVKITLNDDVIESLIGKDELTTILTDVRDLDLSAEMNSDEIVEKLVKNKHMLENSMIVSASVVNFIVSNGELCDTLELNASYLEAASLNQLENYSYSNVWYGELPSLVTALDEIFDISSGGEFEINGDRITDEISEMLKSVNSPANTAEGKTKLDVLYASGIIRGKISARLDSALNGVVSPSVIADAKQDGYYKLDEIRALSAAANIFDMDILSLDGDELSGRVKTEIMALNDPRADYGGESALDIIYPSVIIRSIMTEELDKAIPSGLLGETDRNRIKGAETVYSKAEFSALVDGMNALGFQTVDEISDYDFSELSKLKGELPVLYRSEITSSIITVQIDNATEGLIENSVRMAIKQNSVYTEEEVFSLIEALEELGIKTVDDMDGHDFSDIKSFNGASATYPQSTKLGVIYRSEIVGGVITHEVDESIASSDVLATDDKAYTNGVKIYKQSEIQSLISLLGEASLDDYALGGVEELRQYVAPSENGEPSSYIISATVSRSLVENGKLVVPISVTDGNVIKAVELTALIDAYISVNGNGSFDGWNVEENMVIPEAGAKDLVLASTIMRATLTDSLIKTNSQLTVSEAGAVIDRDCSLRQIAVLGAEEMDAVFRVIEADFGGSGSELKLPAFTNVGDIMEVKDDLDLYYTECSVTRYLINGVASLFADGETQFTSESFVTLSKTDTGISAVKNDVEVMSVYDVEKFLASLDF